MKLRPYQLDAFDAVMAAIRVSTAPVLVAAPTGAGKSHIIAAVAHKLHKISDGKSVLCVAPSAELVRQNHEKFVQNTRQDASLFSASLGPKSLRHPVVFGTPVSIGNSIDKFGARFCAIIIDECHRITPTIKKIIAGIRAHNPNARVIGLSATPYRLGEGYIYRQDETGATNGPDVARDPYFDRRVYTIDARRLIDEGWLTPPVIGDVSEEYDTAGLTVRSMGKFSPQDVDLAFVGHGRKTSKIVGDVVHHARDRSGVMFFAATVAHAEEVLASLPAGRSAMIVGTTKKRDRDRIISNFKAKRIKYLVNVDVLTTGFDASHVDVIALLRATESVALLQQMVGRGLRIETGKKDCLVLDFAGNIERHCPDGDIFDPTIKADKEPGTERMEVECPDCHALNLFATRPDCEGLRQSTDGYLIDLAGNPISTEHGPTPAHLGRRCNGLIPLGHEYERCAHRWTSKPCPDCDEPNDIAARYCHDCRAEMIDPNEKLARAFAAYKKDARKVQCDRVLGWSAQPTVSKSGNPCKKVTVRTEHRTFDLWFTDKSGHAFVQRKFDKMTEATMNWIVEPHTITYRKKGDFYELIDINQPPDQDPSL